jgi:hypothetical protein
MQGEVKGAIAINKILKQGENQNVFNRKLD